MATALGAERCDAYVTPTGIIATITAGSEHRTRIQRITRTGVDLSRVAAVLDISREAAEGRRDRAGVRAALEQVATQPRVYNRSVITVAVGLACACTAVLFGGGVEEFGVAFVAAAVAFLVRESLLGYNLSRPLLTGFVAMLVSGLALGLTRLLDTPHPAQALIASTVFLVPGVLMVSSIADLFRGDTISGVARGTAALLTLVAIAGGTWAMLLLAHDQLDLRPGQFDLLYAAPLLALCSAGGFGVMFDVPRRALFAAAAVGAVAYLVYRLVLLSSSSVGVAAFLAGATISLLAEVLSRPFRLPTSIFSIPGFLPLVPRGAAFRTLLFFVVDDYADATVSLVRTAITVVALVAGIGTVSALARLGRKPAL